MSCPEPFRRRQSGRRFVAIEQIGTVFVLERTHHRGAGIKMNSYQHCHDGASNQSTDNKNGGQSHANRKPARAIHE